MPTNVVLCKECGLGYLNPRWDRESYLRFYRKEYDKYYRPDISKIELSESANHPIGMRFKKYDLLPKEVKNILDIGSGEGSNLRYFKSLFPNSKLFAIEPSTESQKHLEKLGVCIVDDDVDNSWHRDYQSKFDIIIMRHVIEHFMNPVQIMTKIRSILSSSGVVYLAAPNNLNPVQRLESSWFRNVHTYYFNKYSLRNLLKIAGFKPLLLVEGDEFNIGEVYLVARKSDIESRPEFTRRHYEEQLVVFTKKLKNDRNVLHSGIRLMKNIFNKLLLLAKSKRQ